MPLCDAWVGTSGFQFSITSIQKPLSSHAKGRACQRIASRSRLPLEEQRDLLIAAHAARYEHFPPRPVTPPQTPLPTTKFDVSTPSSYRGTTKYSYESLSESDSDMEIDLSSTGRATQHSPRHSAGHHSRPCPGIPLSWARVFQTYPFSRHDPNLTRDGYTLGYTFSGVDHNGTSFRIRSNSCLKMCSFDGQACGECQALSSTVQTLATLAQSAPAHTNHKWLTHEQLCALAASQSAKLKDEKLKTLKLSRQVNSLADKLSEYKRFVMAVATNDFPRLKQLVGQCLKQGTGISSIVSQLERCIRGVYQARGYTNNDTDISLLVLRLGGRKLLYAMAQYLKIPSVRTLGRLTAFTRIMPSPGFPKLSEITFNIKEIFLSTLPHSHQEGFKPRTGVSILWDEISQEEVACYFPHSDSVGGLCREHADGMNTRLLSFEHAVDIARKLESGEVHYGKEASVIAIASFDDRIRGAFPIVVSPTCKAEKVDRAKEIYGFVRTGWAAVAQQYFGIIWTFASDGDANRRKLVYEELMKHQIGPDHTLYKFLGGLAGLNLFVGDGDITGDFDWKHEIKRMARLVRTQDGMNISNTVVNMEIFTRQLNRVPTLSQLDVQRLMNPADSQDVPRAIEFLNGVYDVSQLPFEDCAVGEDVEASHVGVVGEMFAAFTQAFINPEHSITQQVILLSKYAHMAFSLFRRYRESFMPFQLYGDTQTTVKNAIFCIAKQKDMDPTMKFLIYLCGDDREEILFGLVREQGGHDPNASFKQLCERLGAAVDLAGVFARNPHLDPGHRRLKVTRTEHADHLNVDSWGGNIVAGSVQLSDAWEKGREAASAVLKTIGIEDDYLALFTGNIKLDMLRPFGDGSYPGKSDAPDRSLEPEELISTSSAGSSECVPAEDAPQLFNTSFPSSAIVSTAEVPDAETGDADDNDSASEASDDEDLPNESDDPLAPTVVALSDSELAAIQAGTQTTTVLDDLADLLSVPGDLQSVLEGGGLGQPTTSEIASDSSSVFSGFDARVDGGHLEDDDPTEGTQLEDVLPTPPPLELPSLEDNLLGTICHWVMYMGKKIHKASICRLVITPDYIRKSHERVLRVRGFTSHSKFFLLNSSSILDEDAFMVGDVFAAFIICDKQVFLAVFKSIAIEEKTKRVERVKLKSLAHPAAGIKIVGQILDLQQVAPEDVTRVQQLDPAGSSQGHGDIQDSSSGTSVPSGSTPPASPAQPCTLAGSGSNETRPWVWTGDFVKLDPENQKTAPTSKAGIRKTITDAPKDRFPNLRRGITWSMAHDELDLLMTKLWGTIESCKAFTILPRFRSNTEFPYKNLSGIPSLQCDEGTRGRGLIDLASVGKGKLRCYQCLQSVPEAKMRDHVAGHILRALRGVSEELKGEPTGDMPCGFCGRSGIPACARVFLTKGKRPQAVSHCEHARKFRYASALTSTATGPSTNVPIRCTLDNCGGTTVDGRWPAVWKLNMTAHIRKFHPGSSTDGGLTGAPIDDVIVYDMYITPEEETRLGIPAHLIPPTPIPRCPKSRPPPRSSTRPSHDGVVARTAKRKLGGVGDTGEDAGLEQQEGGSLPGSRGP
ncbi:hypothetical protein EIP91_004891 [Steccherinum ochraceum]|uniref:Uncharacterized protein n=1 Tax=Steccherinum ochraceum TaxID=92696 RepID=A0A4R0RGD7_9APHY|nr:hypothetical protein EIP91_004891 [Steccherinum ochraceum]